MTSHWKHVLHAPFFPLPQCMGEPPGRRLYRKGTLAVYAVHGKQEKVYSQNLCLLAKLFLDHKTLYFDVDSFIFYVLVKVDSAGKSTSILGYYSKVRDGATSPRFPPGHFRPSSRVGCWLCRNRISLPFSWAIALPHFPLCPKASECSSLHIQPSPCLPLLLLLFSC